MLKNIKSPSIYCYVCQGFFQASQTCKYKFFFNIHIIMATSVIMPRQGQSVESCIISRWFKAKGDAVKKGDILFGYETDKASFEAEAEADGILLDRFYEEGDEVPVLLVVAVIGNAGENIDSFKTGGSAEATAASTPAVKGDEKIIAAPLQTTASVATKTEGSELKISPRAKNTAEKLGINYEIINGSGPSGRIIEQDVLTASQTASRITPLAKAIAKENNLQIPATGSGVAGRVTSFDVLSPNPVYSDDSEVRKISNMRKIISQKMHESLQNSAQLTHHMGADARRMLDLRKKVKEAADKGLSANITLNDMVCFAVIKALKKNPMANCHFMGDNIRVFKKVHLGLAVDTERGLMVPTVKNADDLTIQGLASQMKALAESCKKGSVSPELLASDSASFTVSNLGAYGVEIFTPVINLPQVAILGVNTIVNRPADLGNGVFGFIPYIGLSLTYDHRALDGAPASAFLRDIKLEIENLDFSI